MPFAKQYEYFEVRELLRNAEGVASPVTNAPAHSRILHAKSMPGSGGTQEHLMLDRTHRRTVAGVLESKNQFTKRGGTGTTSAFANLLQQGSAACEALNSAAGQAVMAVFDAPAHVGKNLRATLNVPITREMGFLPASGAPSLTVSTHNSAVLDKTQNTAGVRLIIDRAAAGVVMHIQTCIPLGAPVAVATWEVKDHNTKLVVANG